MNNASRQRLKTIFDHGAEGASHALSKWLGEEARLSVNDVELADLTAAAELLGPPDTLVAACAMGLSGRLTGLILLVFDDRSGLALVDLLLQQPLGSTTVWNELEQSAASETMNIVGCAYVNALAQHMPRAHPAEDALSQASYSPLNREPGELIPTPPSFFHEFAGSLLDFALMEQARELDKVLLIRTEFAALRPAVNLNWTLLFVPSRESLRELTTLLAS